MTGVELRPLSGRKLEPWYFSAAWYQGMYLAASHRSHWATRKEREGPLPSDEREALELAERISRRLLLASARTLEAIHDGSAPWKTYLPAKDDREALRVFLDDVVEASAAVLLAGIRVELDAPFEQVPPGTVFHPPPRHDLVDQLLEEEHLGSRVVTPGWLIAFADATSNTGRVEYNLACFYSSLAWKERDVSSLLDERRRLAASHLRNALARLNRADLRLLVPWLDKDPSLRGLRDLPPERFKEIKAPLARLAVPKQRKREAPSRWRRLLARLRRVLP